MGIELKNTVLELQAQPIDPSASGGPDAADQWAKTILGRCRLSQPRPGRDTPMPDRGRA